jgi:hypothetical protein
MRLAILAISALALIAAVTAADDDSSSSNKRGRSFRPRIKSSSTESTAAAENPEPADEQVQTLTQISQSVCPWQAFLDYFNRPGSTQKGINQNQVMTRCKYYQAVFLVINANKLEYLSLTSLYSCVISKDLPQKGATESCSTKVGSTILHQNQLMTRCNPYQMIFLEIDANKLEGLPQRGYHSVAPLR